MFYCFLLRAIWEISGTASFEHPLTSRIWKLRSIRAILGLPGCRKVRIDQCMYGLRPGDDVGGSKRYLKPTGLLLCGSAPFDTRMRDHSHEHTQILGSYRRVDGKGNRPPSNVHMKLELIPLLSAPALASSMPGDVVWCPLDLMACSFCHSSVAFQVGSVCVAAVARCDWFWLASVALY